MIQVILMFLMIIVLFGGFSYATLTDRKALPQKLSRQNIIQATHIPLPTPVFSPLSIASMRQKSYPGSSLSIEQTLSSGSNYNRYVVSYLSDGLKIYGLLTIPQGQKPSGGWPVILFNHGYIPPAAYSTILSYSIMVDPLASSGYIVFKPDYRGNGSSQGIPVQPYVSPDYVTDSMNALASIKQYKDANSQKIGVFGHSMGGNIALHELVISHAFKAAELMAGVVGNEEDLAQWWDHRFSVHSIVGNDLDTYYAFEQMIKDHKTIYDDPAFWNAIDPTQFVNFINTPIQIQIGSADEDVPTAFSSSLQGSLQKNNKVVDYKVYSGADHNLEPDTATAMTAARIFFDKYLR